MSALLTALVALLIALCLLAVAFWAGRRFIGPASSGIWTLFSISGLLLLFSIIDLVGIGILTLWPSILLFGFFLGSVTRPRAHR